MGLGISRRAFLAQTAVTIASVGALRLAPEAFGAECAPPPPLPNGIAPFKHAYENWERQIVVDEAWCCSPRTADDVLALADWALEHGWRLRARGAAHSWAPLTVLGEEGCDDRVLLLETRDHLNAFAVEEETVRAQPGATLYDLALGLLEHGLELNSIPTTGSMTLGGMLAVGAHGCVGGARGEVARQGETFGSLPALVTSFTAVAYDEQRRRHVLRRFTRDDLRGAAALSALGRTFVTEATLAVAPAENLRCISRTDVPAPVLFGAPGPGSFASRLDATGRIEVLWYPYTEGTWIKEWSASPRKPASSRAVGGPYNYPFADSVPTALTDLGEDALKASPELTPTYSAAAFEGTKAGLDGNDARDLWGPSAYLYLHHEALNVRIHEAGFVLLCRRDDLQRILHAFTSEYLRLLDVYRLEGLYPVNGPAYIRATSLDDDRPGVRAPALAACRAHPDHPFDTALWMTLVCFPGTPGAPAFFADLEAFCRDRLRPPLALARSEWPKGYAYTPAGGWSSAAQLEHLRSTYPDFEQSRRSLDVLDPHRVFSNSFLDSILGP